MSSSPITSLKKTFGLTSEQIADGQIATLEDIGRQTTGTHTRINAQAGSDGNARARWRPCRVEEEWSMGAHAARLLLMRPDRRHRRQRQRTTESSLPVSAAWILVRVQSSRSDVRMLMRPSHDVASMRVRALLRSAPLWLRVVRRSAAAPPSVRPSVHPSVCCVFVLLVVQLLLSITLL